MKKKLITSILVIIVTLCLMIVYFVFNKINFSTSKNISEQIAIEVIKNKIPDLIDYPSDQFPPKSIKSEEVSNGWHVAFIQEGSGVPIISARCFFVDANKNILDEKNYAPKINEDVVGDFSVTTCSPSKLNEPIIQKCQLQTCHGLDIVCGANPPEVCTAMYGLGDKCLQYVKCGIQNGLCQPIENDKFNQCKLCVQNCLNVYKNDVITQFTCESKCE